MKWAKEVKVGESAEEERGASNNVINRDEDRLPAGL